MFYGGLANAFANTTSIESDFNILKWEKYDFLTINDELDIGGHLSSQATSCCDGNSYSDWV
jgi:hypothetical protein